MTRPTDHSLPGIGCELKIMVSSAPTLKLRASPRESRESTAMGSPWLPVHTTQTPPGGKRLMFSTSMRSAVSTRSRCSFLASFTFASIDRPMKAILRPVSWATLAICWMRWMWLAKQATTMRRSGRSRKRRRRAAPTLLSEGVKPGSSALVESASNRATPSSPRAASRLTSVRRPSIGVRSSLKSPECTMTPTFV